MLAFLLMGGAGTFLQRLWAFCGGARGKNRQYAGYSMAYLPWGLCFYGLFCPCGAGKGGVRAYILWPMALAFWAMEPGLSVAFRESMEGGRAAIPVGETVWPGKIHEKAPQTEKIP